MRKIGDRVWPRCDNGVRNLAVIERSLPRIEPITASHPLPNLTGREATRFGYKRLDHLWFDRPI